MKYLIFNGVVAAALIYLVAGDKIDLNNPVESIKQAAEEIDATAITDEATESYQQTVMETARQVASVTAERVAKEVTNQLLTTQANEQADNKAYAEVPADNLAPIVEAEFIETTPDYVIDEASAAAGSSNPVLAEETVSETTSQTISPPALKLAEGEELMSPRIRQQELDKLAQNMEFLFLSTQ